MSNNAKFNLPNDQTIEIPVLKSTIGPDAIDMRSFGKSGFWSFDSAFLATASCESKITYIDGDKGQLFYRGYPIEQLAEHSSHLESAYLLLNGELPTDIQLAEFVQSIQENSNVHPDLYKIINNFANDTHPMAILTSLVAANAGYYPEYLSKINDRKVQQKSINQLIAQIPTLVSMLYRHQNQLEFLTPRKDLSYSENFLYMMFGKTKDEKPNPIIAKALDCIFLTHADHEQNASTSTVRLAGSSGTHPYAAIAAGIACLWGPAHGGANEAVLNMLEEIGDESKVEEYVQGVKDKKYRLMGFGHRVYKNMDPRADIIRDACYKVLNTLGKNNDPLFKLAMKLEKHALSDEYFIQKKLYPNVDFYSGIILRAIGIPTQMFTTIFALARTVGWLAQWQEMITDPNLKIGRPRQLYTGATTRDYTQIEKR